MLIISFVSCIFDVVKRNAKNIGYTHIFLVAFWLSAFVCVFSRVALVRAILVLFVSAFGKILQF